MLFGPEHTQPARQPTPAQHPAEMPATPALHPVLRTAVTERVRSAYLGQFAIDDRDHVVLFDPETADRTVLGESLEEWAAWLLHPPEAHGCGGPALAWQRAHGAVAAGGRLLPRQSIALGGSPIPENFSPAPAAEAVTSRGPLALVLHDLPDGATMELTH